MAHVLVIGGVSVNTIIHLDSFPQPQPQTLVAHSWHEAIGSTGAGKALNLRKLGYPITLHAPIGDDAAGRAIIEHMAREDIAFLYDYDPAGTQRHVNLMDRDGQRISIFIVPGTADLVFDQQRLEAHIAQAAHVVLNVSNYCRTLIPAIKRHHQAIWCDIHSYNGTNPYFDDFIRAADYLMLSSQDLPDYRAFMEQMIIQGKRLVFCTHGRQGASALSAAGEWIDMPILEQYLPVDSNGAGDAFFAGMLHGFVQGYQLEQCMRLGTIMGGLCVTSPELAPPTLSRVLVEAAYQAAYGETLPSSTAAAVE